MLDSKHKFLTGLVLISLCGLNTPQAAAQQKPQSKETGGGETPEVAMRFSEVVRAKNAKGAVVPLKVEVKSWTVSRSDRALKLYLAVSPNPSVRCR